MFTKFSQEDKALFDKYNKRLEENIPYASVGKPAASDDAQACAQDIAHSESLIENEEEAARLKRYVGKLEKYRDDLSEGRWDSQDYTEFKKLRTSVSHYTADHFSWQSIAWLRHTLSSMSFPSSSALAFISSRIKAFDGKVRLGRVTRVELQEFERFLSSMVSEFSPDPEKARDAYRAFYLDLYTHNVKQQHDAIVKATQSWRESTNMLHYCNFLRAEISGIMERYDEKLYRDKETGEALVDRARVHKHIKPQPTVLTHPDRKGSTMDSERAEAYQRGARLLDKNTSDKGAVLARANKALKEARLSRGGLRMKPGTYQKVGRFTAYSVLDEGADTDASQAKQPAGSAPSQGGLFGSTPGASEEADAPIISPKTPHNKGK